MIEEVDGDTIEGCNKMIAYLFRCRRIAKAPNASPMLQAYCLRIETDIVHYCKRMEMLRE